jgi:hypothetical protein
MTRTVSGSPRHIALLFMSATTMVALGCSRPDTSARQTDEAEAKAIAAIAEGIRPLVARCEQLGMTNDVPDASKVLVIDLKEGARHPAMDELPVAKRGRASDSDLLAFAVVRVSEERLKGYYNDATFHARDGIQVNAELAAVRWPSKEPVGLYTVKAQPPEVVTVRQGEVPRGDIVKSIADAIKLRKFADRPQDFILGLWKLENGKTTVTLKFAADKTCNFNNDGRPPGRMYYVEAGQSCTYKYKFIDPSMVDLEIVPGSGTGFGSAANKARISRLTKTSFQLTWEGKSWSDTFNKQSE